MVVLKARDLVNQGISSKELRERQDELLNDTQKVGLQHYEDLLLEFRDEIVQFESFSKWFAKISNKYRELILK